MQSTSAKSASAAISKAVLEHNLSCAREAVQMAANAKDATSAIAAAATVVDAVERIMCSGVSRSAAFEGINTLRRAVAASTTAEELAEIVYTAKLIAAVTYAAAMEAITYAAAMEAISATSAFSATADTAAISESASSMRKRKGYTRLE